MPINRLLFSLSIVSCSTLAAAQSYEFTIDQEASLIDRSLNIQVPFSGTLIGDYNADTNPDG